MWGVMCVMLVRLTYHVVCDVCGVSEVAMIRLACWNALVAHLKERKQVAAVYDSQPLYWNALVAYLDMGTRYAHAFRVLDCPHVYLIRVLHPHH